MALLSFARNSPKNNPAAAFFHHGTPDSDRAHAFLLDYCERNGISLQVGCIQRSRLPDESPEEYWRNERNRFFGQLRAPDGLMPTILQAHHLNDQMENWIFTSLHGTGRLIPYARDNIRRPFLLCEKAQLKLWCQSHKVPWIEDQSNTNVRYARNRIRHNILPEALQINPGLPKTVRKLVEQMVKNDG